MTLPDIWLAFQSAHLPTYATLLPPLTLPPRADNPFLINYVFHHHYRSLGWVVKNGIKFCVDYLLYKRGPVFHHAEYVSRCLHSLIRFYVRSHQIRLGPHTGVRGSRRCKDVAFRSPECITVQLAMVGYYKSCQLPSAKSNVTCYICR